MKKCIFSICLIFASFYSDGQTLFDSAKNELVRINQMLDSSSFLSFDFKIDYKGILESVESTMATNQILDSNGNYYSLGSESIEGYYVLNDQKIYYEIGDVIFAQTDSFTYNIYKDEQMMLMTKKLPISGASYFPFKEFLDSVLIPAHYTVTIDTVDISDTTLNYEFDKVIVFNANSNAARFNNIMVRYDSDTYYPHSFSYSYQESGVSAITEIPEIDSLLVDAGDVTLIVNRYISMGFSNYKSNYDSDVFNDSEYVIYNRRRKVYETSEKYKNYQFYTAGFENADPEEEMYTEIPYVEPEEN